jgi:hypothetical protein
MSLAATQSRSRAQYILSDFQMLALLPPSGTQLAPNATRKTNVIAHTLTYDLSAWYMVVYSTLLSLQLIFAAHA